MLLHDVGNVRFGHTRATRGFLAVREDLNPPLSPRHVLPQSLTHQLAPAAPFPVRELVDGKDELRRQ